MTRDDGGGRIERAAHALLQARRQRTWLEGLAPDALPQRVEEAYSIQDRVVMQLGGRGGWKVGAANPTATPGCAPLPAPLIAHSPARVARDTFQLVGIEVEVAFRFARALPRRDRPYAVADVLSAVASVHPAIEIVDSRYRDFRARSQLEQLADGGNHGGFVLGAASTAAASVDQTLLACELWIDGARRVTKTGGNTAGDVQRLLAWLVNHCAERDTPIEAGMLVTTGSCTGLELMERGEARGVVRGVGEVLLSVE